MRRLIIFKMNHKTEYKGLRILLISVVLCGLFHIVEAGVNYRFDETRCSNDNSIKLGQVIVDCYGIDTIRSWLKKDFNIVLFCNLDSNGQVLKFVRVRSHFRYFNNKYKIDAPIDTSRLLQILKKNNVKFSICLSEDFLYLVGDTSKAIALAIEAEDLNKLIVGIAFPGVLENMIRCDTSENMADYILNVVTKHNNIKCDE